MSDQCEHGNLRRQCQVCELIAERDELASGLRLAELALRQAYGRTHKIYNRSDNPHTVRFQAEQVMNYCQEALSEIPDPTQYEGAQ